MTTVTSFAKDFSRICGLLLVASAGLVSCSENDTPLPVESDSKNIDYSAANAAGWHNYSVRVGQLLANDSKNLYNAWESSYNGGEAFKNTFKNHASPYTSPIGCIEEILDGCAEIANEVGEAKIGDPYDLYKSNKLEEALYAVESWYSWHSRDDYSNNILSVRNSYFGSLTTEIADASMSALVESRDPGLDARMKAAVDAAYNAILAIPQPFRNNIGSMEAVAAMNACTELDHLINNELKPFFHGLGSSYDATLSDIVANYVDNVVLPTYKSLMERNDALLNAVKELAAAPSDRAFSNACDAWLSSREPWEKSEAFLFGPVDAMGLDPNMDSWPLDQDAIVNHLKSGNFDDLDWGEGDDDQKVEAAQNIRGFHTLEFLLFKDGKPRKVN